MADGINVANAYVQILPSMEGATSSITDAILPALQGAGEQGGAVMGTGILGKLGELSGPLAALGGTLIGALGAKKIGEALLDIGGEFDAMHDAIVIGTGASGDALAALEDAAKDIATSVGGSFGDAGDIVQDLNTRLGLAGDELTDVGERVAAAGHLLGGAINVESMSGAFAAWGTEASDMAGEMDYLFSVAQNTGIGFDDLTGILERNAPALQGLGLTFEESANMAGLLDRAGMDASGMMGRMGKALTELTQPGESAAEAYRRVLDEMQGYIDAGDEAAAMDLATELFGTKGATQFIGAVKSGALSMDALTDASLGAGDGIMGTFDATKSWTEQWDQLKNNAMVALEPLSGALMEGVMAALEKVSEAIAGIDPATLEGIGEALGDLFGALIDGATTAAEVLSPLIDLLGDVFVGVVVPAVEGALQLLSGDFDGAKESLANAFNGMRDIVANVSDAIKNRITERFNAAKEAMTKPINTAKETIKSAIDKIKEFFNVKLSFPSIKMPHFRIDGGEVPWGIGGVGRKPTISIDWYGEGGVVDGARLIGVGERGPELIWPAYEPYLSKYADAIAEAGGSGGGVNLYIDGLVVNDDPRIRADVLQIVTDLGRYSRAATAAGR